MTSNSWILWAMLSAIFASLPLAIACTPPGPVSTVSTSSCGRRNLMSMFSRKPTRRGAAAAWDDGTPAPISGGRDSTIVNL